MFAGQYYCKIDEKGRFVVPTPIREELETQGSSLMFLKGQDLPVSAYTKPEWEKILQRARESFNENQSRLFMYYMVSEASASEMDKAGRILVPGRLRKLIPVDEDNEVVIVGMFHRLEVWNPSEWRRFVHQNDETFEQNMGKVLNLL